MLSDQSILTNNQRRTQTSLSHGLIHRTISEFNLPQTSYFSKSSSLSSSFSSLISSPPLTFNKEPPLLPLPALKPSTAYNNKKTNKSYNHKDLRDKKTRSFSDVSKRSKGFTTVSSSTDQLGPDPSHHLPMQALNSSKSPSLTSVSKLNELDKFHEASVLYASPPPSSLPLPKFSMRPRRRCNADAGATESGATDDLQRLL